MNDEKIINFIKKRNEKGLQLIIDNYGGLITSIVRKHLYNLQDRQEECIDDILLSIWNKIDSFNGDKNSFKNWIGAISQYRAIDYKRKYVKCLQEEDINDIEVESHITIDKDLMENEVKEEIRELLCCLNTQDREIFIKRYFEDKCVDEIALEIGIGESAIYNRLSRGRKKIKNKFEKIISN
ncbi:sigma-70 family RNA polymerase sigma factor [Clostridium gasigenes]|uniref:sigma-70 family RNA polymerase sigma factor n=1 Tax=Clostridium gasigenes TaxID=94869 RepID=UPI001C0E74CB|nr:sigma-70 family RNA polymerase sigma factor [Clostridium gasigenes]MBU3137439.1 sigma-70 family RNA polymerase sigma factor [Clostridium gasigenes]